MNAWNTAAVGDNGNKTSLVVIAVAVPRTVDEESTAKPIGYEAPDVRFQAELKKPMPHWKVLSTKNTTVIPLL